MRRRRGGQGVKRRLFRGARRGRVVAVAERICRSLGVLHHHAGLVLGVRRGLEGVVDGLHQGDVGQAGVDDAADLQALQDRRRIAQRLVDDQVGDGAQARIEHHRVRDCSTGCSSTCRHRRSRPGTVGIDRRPFRPAGMPGRAVRGTAGRQRPTAPGRAAGCCSCPSTVRRPDAEVVGRDDPGPSRRRRAGLAPAARSSLRDLDLRQNEIQIASDIGNHDTLTCCWTRPQRRPGC